MLSGFDSRLPDAVEGLAVERLYPLGEDGLDQNLLGGAAQGHPRSRYAHTDRRCGSPETATPSSGAR